MDYLVFQRNPFARRKYNTVLREVNLHIRDGDKIAFLGTNGAGKSTLLKLIGGLLYPSRGTIRVDGFDTYRENKKARRNVGFVLNEERSFYWQLTGRQNLQFFGALNNQFGPSLDHKIRDLFEMVGLERDGDKLVSGYSSGMKQRLAIARGLISNPNILILDEPTRTLDPISLGDVKGIIKDRLHLGARRTLLIVTHRLEEAAELCDKVCIINNGTILHYGTMSHSISAFGGLEACYKHFIGQSALPVSNAYAPVV